MQLNRKVGDKNNEKNMLFFEHCAAHMENVIFLSHIKTVFLQAKSTSPLQSSDLGIILVFKCNQRKQLIQKTVTMTDARLLQDAIKMNVHVLPAMHFTTEAWRL
jgi:hypothetical protein